MKAYLQHGSGGGPFRTEEVSLRSTATIPPRVQVHYLGRWRTVRDGKILVGGWATRVTLTEDRDD